MQNELNQPRETQSIETIMALQLVATFCGFKIHRPLSQRVLRTPNPLLFKYNELPKIFVPPSFVKACHGPVK